MDENVLSYLGMRKHQDEDNNWREISELEELRNIRQTRTSTRQIQIQWGTTGILIKEERHYESL